MTAQSDQIDARAVDSNAPAAELEQAARVADGQVEDPDAYSALPTTVLSLAVQYRTLSDALFALAASMQAEVAGP